MMFGGPPESVGVERASDYVNVGSGAVDSGAEQLTTRPSQHTSAKAPVERLRLCWGIIEYSY